MSGTILEQYQLLRQTQPTCRVLQVWIAAASRFASTGRQKTCLKWLEKAFFQVYTYIHIYIYIYIYNMECYTKSIQITYGFHGYSSIKAKLVLFDCKQLCQ
jgi:hypothetical protein